MTALPEYMNGLPRVFVGQGEVVATREPVVLQTTLGSCVALVLHDPVTGMGAMCHALMPEAGEHEQGSLRFADVAADHMLGIFTAEGIALSRLNVRLFGGAVPVTPKRARSEIGKVGPRNVEVVRRRLERRGLVISAEDTGGPHGRRVLFAVSSGEVYVHLLLKRATEV